MKIDLYTKTVLTVIAICLLLIIAGQWNIIPDLKAAEKTDNRAMPAHYGLVPLNEDGTIDVNVVKISTYDELEVDIREIGGSSVNYELPVDIKKVGGSTTYSEIPVKIK